jgi:hypothetical protein
MKVEHEMRLHIDLPVVLRRQLARRSVQMDIDLESLILKIIENDFISEKR